MLDSGFYCSLIRLFFNIFRLKLLNENEIEKAQLISECTEITFNGLIKMQIK